MVPAPIGRVDLAPSLAWVSWTPHAGPEQADDVAAVAADTDEGRRRIADAVRDEDAGIARLANLSVAALWVPDRVAADPVAFLYAGPVRDPGSATAVEYATVQRTSGRQRLKTLARVVEETTVPAGPAVVTIEVRLGWRPRRVVSSVSWMIFPTDLAGAVRLVARTTREEAFEDLAGEVRAVAEELVIEEAGPSR